MISDNYDDIDDPAAIDIADLTEEEIIGAMVDVDDMDLDEDVSAIEAVGENDQGTKLNLDDEIKEVKYEQKQESQTEPNRDETDIRPQPLNAINPVDEILKKVYGIVKPICENVDISCEWQRNNTVQSGYIKIFNPKTDKFSPFFPTLNLIIYDTDGSLFIKLFYQQCKVFKKSVVKDASNLLNKPEEYIAIVTLLASFISELSLHKYQPCQGAFEKNKIINNYPRGMYGHPRYQNLLTEKQGDRIVYRTMDCNLLTEKGNTRCSPCSDFYFEIFGMPKVTGKMQKNHTSAIMGILRDSSMGRLTFAEIFQRVSDMQRIKKIPPGYEKIILNTLMREEAFKESKQGDVTYWEINSAKVSKTEDLQVLKTINDPQDTNSIYKSSQKKRKVSDNTTNNAKEKVALVHPVPSLIEKTPPSRVTNVSAEKLTVQQVQHIQKPIPTHLLSRVVLKENQVFKINQPKNTETKHCETSSEQESFNSTNISGPIVQPVMNLNSIFETKTNLGLVFTSSVETPHSPSKKSSRARDQQINRKFNPARIESTKTGTVVKYW